MDLHYEDIRRDYGRRSLSRKDLTDDPFDLVRLWLQEAVDDPKVLEPTAVLVCTSTPDGHPSSRTVLLKELLGEEFIFYSNYESRKGQQMAANPHVSLTFLWHELERQIHVEGTVRHLEPELSDQYFATRPYKSRVGARISPQSHPIPARELTIGAHLFRVWQLLSHLSEVPQTNQMIHVIICNNTTFTQNRRKHGCACNMFFPVSW